MAIDSNDLPNGGESVEESIRRILELNPESCVFAFVDEGASGALFDIEQGNLDNEVKAIGLLILKVAAQTDKPLRLVADDAVGLAEHLMNSQRK